MQVFSFTPRSIISRHTLMVTALYFCVDAQFTQTFAYMNSLKVVPVCPMLRSCPIYSLLRKSRLNASVPF